MATDPGRASGEVLAELVTAMDRLRRECPWDGEQTHGSLAPYLLEETHEALEAVAAVVAAGGVADGAAGAHLREELGDVLLQVVFHARVASERAGWGIDDVVTDLLAKLVHRHPHVFAGTTVAGVEDVEARWEELKQAEKGRTGLLDGIPPTLPGLAYASKALGRLERAGRPVPAADPGGADDLGERLLALVAAARAQGRDPEAELRSALARWT